MSRLEDMNETQTAEQIARRFLKELGWKAMTPAERTFAVAMLGPDLNGTFYDGRTRHEPHLDGCPRSFVPAQ